MGVEVLTDVGGRLRTLGIARALSKNLFSRLPPLRATCQSPEQGLRGSAKSRRN